jgi:alpha-galactosidase
VDNSSSENHSFFSGLGLPALFANEEEAETLSITLADTAGRLQAVLRYTIFAGKGPLTRYVCYTNTSTNEPVELSKASSFCVDFPDHDFDRLSLYGGHAHERNLERIRLMHGIMKTGSVPRCELASAVPVPRAGASEHG